MNRLIYLSLIVFIFLSCKKSEPDFIWERSYSSGNAYFIKASTDSGFYSCGSSGGNPYFVRFNKNKNIIIQIKAEKKGLFSSSWYDKSGYITAGSSEGKMLLMRHSPTGIKLWERLFDAGFNVDFTNLIYSGKGGLLAIATASADSSDAGATGLLFVRFDTIGHIINQKKITETSFVAVNDAIIDFSGNIYLAVTNKTIYANSKASVAKYNDIYQKIWETDLYNNPEFGAASFSVLLDDALNVYVAGYTDVASEEGKHRNSFLASLTNSGLVLWKRYLENSNTGSALIFDEFKNLMMLNRNCFIINSVNTTAGSDAGIIRPFSLCVSEYTDALGYDFDINTDKNILLSGSKGGNFYIAIKSSK